MCFVFLCVNIFEIMTALMDPEIILLSHQEHESPVNDHQNAQKTQQSQSRRLRAMPRQGLVLSSSTVASLQEAGPTARK